MKICFTFICLLSFSISDAYINDIFKNPSLFLSSLTDADPATTQKMKDMVANLIEDGENERANLIAAHDAAQKRYDTAATSQTSALSAKLVAAGHVHIQDIVVNELTVAEGKASAKRADTLNIMNAAEDESTTMADILASENIRLDAEGALLQQMLEKLGELLPGVDFIQGKLKVVSYVIGRNLLSDAGADREAIQKVVDKLNAMVVVGENERNTAIQNDAEARAAFESATTAHNDAVAAHQKLAGELGAAEDDLARLNGVLSVRILELAAADSELASATSDLDTKKTTREEEELRLNSEKATLLEVQNILNEKFS